METLEELDQIFLVLIDLLPEKYNDLIIMNRIPYLVRPGIHVHYNQTAL